MEPREVLARAYELFQILAEHGLSIFFTDQNESFDELRRKATTMLCKFDREIVLILASGKACNALFEFAKRFRMRIVMCKSSQKPLLVASTFTLTPIGDCIAIVRRLGRATGQVLVEYPDGSTQPVNLSELLEKLLAFSHRT